MKISIILSGIIFLSALISCNKPIKAEKGGIDIISNVYFNASKSLDNMKSFHISRINYSHDTILELVPDLDMPTINSKAYLIKDSIFFHLDEQNLNKTVFSNLNKTNAPFSVFEKKDGAIFSNDEIPNYRNKKKLSDTVLFKKKYKRFEINSPWTYTRFYIYETDTILPYSLYKVVEKDFSGRLERIDSYNKKKDIFVTLQLVTRNHWDNEAKDLFNFNHFLKKSSKK